MQAIKHLSRSTVATLGLLVGASLAAPAAAAPRRADLPATARVIGYIPAYKGIRSVIDSVDLGKLTHINLAFANPAVDGSFLNGDGPACMDGTTAAELTYAVNKAHAAHVKVLISVAGGGIPACSGDWSYLLQPAQRASTVAKLKAFVQRFNLDGVDVDLENDLLASIDSAGNYTPFVAALRAALPAHQLLTAATASWFGGMLPASAIPYMDWVGLMAYDAVGPGWGAPGGEHSPMSQATSSIATWQARGLPKEKLVLGIPFYGYGFNGYDYAYSFAQLLTQFGTAAGQSDLIGTLCPSCAYITYNGHPTVRAKTALALEQGSGVMVWELAQDATGNDSLLSTISATINKPVLWQRKIEAESYSNAGGVQTEPCSEGTLDVTAVDTGDWLVYGNVTFPTSGAYKVEYRVASPGTASRLSLDLNGGAIQLGAVDVAPTAGPQQWSTVSHTVNINAGTYNVGLYAATGGWKLNWLRFIKL